jgi:hypothetical protein
MIVQMLLAGFGASDAPVLGGLHVVNAVVIVGVTYALVRESRVPVSAAAADAPLPAHAGV